MTTALLGRVRARVLVTDAGCWQWQGSRKPNGYGEIRIGRKLHYVHRVTFGLVKGVVPEGHDLDHLCRNRSCCNPDHLEPVTRRENMLRGDHVSAVAVRTNRCKRGHEFTPGNTILNSKSGSRRCRACHYASQARSKARRRAA